MTETEPPSKSYEQPRRYEIPERFRPAPRADKATRPGHRNGPTADRASEPTQPVPRPAEAQAVGAATASNTEPVRGPAAPPPRRTAGPPPHHGGSPAGLRPTGRRSHTKLVLLAIAAVVIVVGAALGAYLALSGGGGTSDATAARQTSDKIYTALNAHNADALKHLSCNPLAAPLGSVPGSLSTVHKAGSTSGLQLSGGTAASTGTMVVTDPAGRPVKVDFRLQLHKRGSDWCYSGLDPTSSQPVGAPPSNAARPSPGGAGTTCYRLAVIPLLDRLLSVRPVPTEELPESFVPPTAGARIASCLSHFRGSGHLAHAVVWTGALMQQYVSQLKQLQWQVVGASPAAPVLQNGVGVRVTVVHDGSQLVILLDDGH